jgi:hypothetical protein
MAHASMTAGQMRRPAGKTLTTALWGLAAFLSAGVALFSYRYFVDIHLGVPQIVAKLAERPWLLLHIAGAATALLIGPLNLLPVVRRRWPAAHRWIGRTYIVACLMGGVGGFVAAFSSFAGPIATAGFTSLAVCWVVANTQGWLTARARRFDQHRAWMIRSFAMTFGAVTLRLYLPLLPLFHIDFLDGYRAISFLAWVPNLVVAELYLRGAFLRRAPDTALAAS